MVIHVSSIISWICISAIALPPFLIATICFRGRPPWKVTTVFVAALAVSFLGAVSELRKQQVFYSFARSQGYDTELVPFFYLPDQRINVLIKTYVICLVLSTILSLITVCVIRLRRSQKAQRDKHS
jgi:hypothetical protein